MKKTLISTLLIITLLFSTFMLGSCVFFDGNGLFLADGHGTDKDSSGSSGTSGGSDEGGDVTINVEGGDNYNVSINSTVQPNILAASKSVLSAVSIYCNYERNQYSWSGNLVGTTKATSSGSGVIYKLDKNTGTAYVITNYHVVYDAYCNTKNKISDDITLYLYGQEATKYAIKATYVGGSLYYDIAVLHVDGSEMLKNSDACAVEIADSDKVRVGENAIAIGNAKGLGISASSGVVSIDSEYLTMTAADGKTEVSFRVMRVDTAVNSGNSGGGLYDGTGKLIGIVNAKIVDDGVENIGYAIPSNVAVSIADNILDYCFGTELERVQRALLGITVTSTDSKAVYDAESGYLGIKETVAVYEVSSGLLASDALMAEDVLVSATTGGKTVQITRQYHIIDMMLDVRAGDTVELTVLRGGEEKTVSFKITEGCLTEY